LTSTAFLIVAFFTGIAGALQTPTLSLFLTNEGQHPQQTAENDQAFTIAFAVGTTGKKLADENADDDCCLLYGHRRCVANPDAEPVPDQRSSRPSGDGWQTAENDQAFTIAFAVGTTGKKLADENADDGASGKAPSSAFSSASFLPVVPTAKAIVKA
jgi:hypothetical protein